MNTPATASPRERPSTAPARLENGDRLTRIEFERRYDAMPDLKKAELIDGVVFMGSPVTHDRHGNPHFNLIGWLSHYAAFTPGVEGGDNATLRLDMHNVPQPDAYLLIRPDCGGRAQIDEGYVVGGPELVAEVSASTVSIDLHDKLDTYCHNGVQEYVVWRVDDRQIDWFVLRDGRFEPLPLQGGVYESQVLPGLRLDPAALIAGNLAGVFQVVQQGVATPAHAAFVQRLQAAAAGGTTPQP
jgi:Uma2 family endonuclease